MTGQLARTAVLAACLANCSWSATLLHHWTFDENSLSTTATDSVGSLVLELASGAAVAAPGAFGGGLAMNRGTATCTTEMGTSTDGYSIAIWFKAGDNLDSPDAALFNFVNPDFGSGAHEIGLSLVNGLYGSPEVQRNTTFNYFDVDRTDPAYNSQSPPDGQYEVPDDEFVHVVVATAGLGQTKRLWINAVEQTLSGPWGAPNTAQQAGWKSNYILHVGHLDGGRLHNSVLDDLRMYQGVLTQEEINELARQVNAHNPNPN